MPPAGGDGWLKRKNTEARARIERMRRIFDIQGA
jgi:hypothetical protein